MKKLSIFFAVALLFSCALMTLFVNKTNAVAAVYDISEVTSVVEAGGELSVAPGWTYTGTKAIGYGETVKLAYKNTDSTKQLRMSFAIGAYGFYFYYNPGGVLKVQGCVNLNRDNVNIAEIDRTVFDNYNELEFVLTEKDESNVTLTMTYANGANRASVVKDFTKDSNSDGLFKFVDKNFDGNMIKSLANPTVFGNGFTYTGANTSGLNVYGGCTLSVVAKEKASEKGIPDGFTADSVLVASSSKSSFDMAFDFSPLNYKQSAITSMSFKVFIEKNAETDNASYPEIRITTNAGGSWVLRSVVGSAKTGQWLTITLSDAQIAQLCQNGILGKFAFGVRANGIAKMYVDSITVDVVPPDTEVPVIVAPITRFKTTEGTYPDLSYISATDDSGVVELEYIWSNGALDYNGRLIVGNHTCTVKAIDPSNNSSEVVISFEVLAEKPVEIYSLIFRQNGEDDIAVKYSKGTESYVVVPEVKSVQYYIASWSNFEFEYKENQIVTAVYTPIVYTVTYVADGETVAMVEYSIENFNFDIPAVPEKEGYEGKWQEHEFNFENITVNAVYTEKTVVDPDPADSSDSGSGEQSVEDMENCSSSVAPGGTFVLLLAFAVVFVMKRKMQRAE